MSRKELAQWIARRYGDPCTVGLMGSREQQVIFPPVPKKIQCATSRPISVENSAPLAIGQHLCDLR